MLEACDNNNSDIVRILMDNGADPNKFDNNEHRTTLYSMTSHGNVKINQFIPIKWYFGFFI